MKSYYKYFSLLILLCIVFSNSRIAFTRPGGMMRSAGDMHGSANRLVGISIGSEVFQNSQGEWLYNGGIAVNFSTKSNIEMAITGSRRMVGRNELGFHFQRKILQYGDLSITMGAHDILFGSGTTTLDFYNISPFLNISTYKEYNQFKIIINGGFGAGKLIYDPHNDPDNDVFYPGVYVGFAVRTPYLLENGGSWVLFEYAGGPHLGARFPITKEYSLNLAITNINNIANFTAYENIATATAISLGMGIELPKNRKQSETDQPALTIFPKNAEADEIDIPYTDYEQYTDKINQLRDSLKISDYEIKNLSSERMMLNQKILQLTDSTRKMHLYSQVQSDRLNESMQLLSQSLRLMFENDYKGALDAIDGAIDLSPNLAIAYSRKGAIYYRMGDPQRAAMYWNIALKIDPEFEEIYDMLDALKDDRIELNSVDN